MTKHLSKLMADGHYYLPEGGAFVSEKQRRIAEILSDYDPTLELQWIPPGQRSSDDVAFRVVHRPPGRPPYIVLTASELDERLLARVFDYDQRRGAQSLGSIENYNNALELVRAKVEHEKLQEAHELAAAIIRSPKYHYRHNGVDYERDRRSE